MNYKIGDKVVVRATRGGGTERVIRHGKVDSVDENFVTIKFKGKFESYKESYNFNAIHCGDVKIGKENAAATTTAKSKKEYIKPIITQMEVQTNAN